MNSTQNNLPISGLYTPGPLIEWGKKIADMYDSQDLTPELREAAGNLAKYVRRIGTEEAATVAARLEAHANGQA